MWTPNTYLIIIQWLPRLLGFIYLFMFFPFIFQMKGLFGENGILPIKDFLHVMHLRYGKKAYYYFPSFFWISSSDLSLIGVPIIGTFVSILLILGYSPALLLPLLYLLHLSVVSTGQEFLGFGWELFFLEIAFNTTLLSWSWPPNLFIWISLNLLIIRFHIQAGAVKFQSHDQTWKHLTALNYHYQTQPLPSTLAWYAHHLPKWFQKTSCLFMFFVELVVPILVFGNDIIRLIAALFFIFLQISIWISGNYSYLNYLTVVLCLLLISDVYLQPLTGPAQPIPSSSTLLNYVVSVFGIALITLQLMRLWHSFIYNQTFAKILDYIYPFHLANRYGIFAVMTTERIEIVLKGSHDGENWKEYHFWFKPSEPNRRPRRIAPFQSRIDWQAWFLPFSYYEENRWFKNFINQIFENSPDVLKLIRHNPFPETPPKFIQADMYLYKFSDPITKKKTGDWWTRTYIRHYTPILKNL